MGKTPDPEAKDSVKRMLAEFRKKRKKENKQLREEINRSKQKRKLAIQELLGQKENMQKEETRETGVKVETVAEKAEKLKEKEEAPAEEFPEKEAREISDEEILEVIRVYPEGIKLPEIGEELGVHYIQIANLVSDLVEAEQVEKEDKLYKIQKNNN
ncbi:MAG: hypothetical protein K9K76_06885 [Halanaerobiales bacterium]|nr:hypothetical protein [Halanaerobiales bacterium]